MNRYIINENIIINQISENDLKNCNKQFIIYTPSMIKVFILGDVEIVILNEFVNPLTIEESLNIVKSKFDEAFNEDEYLSFVTDLIEEKIILEYGY